MYYPESIDDYPEPNEEDLYQDFLKMKERIQILIFISLANLVFMIVGFTFILFS